VDKDRFNQLFVNYTALTPDEAGELVNLVSDFPYSQIIHNLAARASQDAHLANQENILHLSAIYSTDRSALKTVMVAPRQKRIEFVLPNPENTQPTLAASDNQKSLYERVMEDFEAMHAAKRKYEALVDTLEQAHALPLAENRPEKKTEKAELEKKTELQKKATEAKGNNIIDEIKSTRKKIKPEGEKQKEQGEIIDQFIKAQPAISRPQPSKKGLDEDLSEPSNQFNESIVSETLVEILLKQGKKEKAIEALKKLIWKFPQKKAYFAAQIEELRK
jgi:hypothetical protein